MGQPEPPPARHGLQDWAQSLGPADLALVALQLGLILVSVVGNCLVCVAIFTDRRLRKLGNAFIVSLAIADLFVSCLVMTFALCNDLMNRWIFGDWFCDVWISFDIMCSTASILNLCAISLDRFIHIKDCLLYNQWMTRRVALSAVIIIWFISGLVSVVPINLGWHRPLEPQPPSASLGPSGPLWAPPEPAKRLAGPGQEPASPPPPPPEPRQARRDKLDYQAAWGNPIENQSSSAGPLAGGQAGSGAGPDFLTSLGGKPAGQLGPAAAAMLHSGPPGAQFNQPESNPPNGGQIMGIGPGELPQMLAANQTALRAGAGPPEQHQHHQQHLALAGPAQSVQQPPPEQVEAQKAGQQQCVLALTPSYAVISSAISFYIPCLIMLGLYTKLFACAQRHVRNIQAASKAPAPLAAPGGPSRRAGRTWLKLSPKRPARAAAQQLAASQIQLHQETRPFLLCASYSAPAAPDTPLKGAPRLAQVQGLPAKPSPSQPQAPPQAHQAQQQQQQRHILAANQQGAQTSGQLATHKAAVTLGIIMGTFLFCWVPFFCLNIIKAFCVDCIPSSVFRAFTWLGYANSALNPIIYGIHNSEFRHAFNRIFFKHLNIKNSRYYQNRRLSYDLRHTGRRNQQHQLHQMHQQPQSGGFKLNAGSYKSDSLT